jgi:tetratricopeptide (TPR) repeat protein
MNTIFGEIKCNLLVQANQLRELKTTQDKTCQNIKEALEIFNKLLSEIGEMPELLATISICHFQLASLEQNHDRYLQAIYFIQCAIDLTPNNPLLHSVLADYYELGTNEYENAAIECRKAIELYPHDVQTLNTIVRLYRYPELPGNFEEMVGWLNRLIELEPNEPRHHAYLAEQYYHIGRIQEAKDEAIKSLLCIKPLEGLTDEMKSILML